ncbi:pyruvate dehydrogenase E1 component subunit alpha [Novosphingobium marinum]|uniref:Pyruvate dehydrogenase E1 component alpha subunit n=1 Tax=Novosphingobium marinum TaxID=1514948 RepID=A0A7Z0BUZ4_9SPHN|nr:thiamine pyrophosphate-dependent dehydrogenase E1 component subunit alpha [Novosphingobium marinum]NYH96769.1 pyruvate dehydrogenase E1 component alpha subunit [Novosphingobium marinum]GGC40385.1 pyruvate dehydrogenase E1 component subunit alpha [Novosphingobium marinum]
MSKIGDNDPKLEKYRRMQRIRQFEAKAEAIHAQGEIPGALHTYAGMEASGVGACMALRDDDYMVGNHRSHGHPIAKGAELRPLMAELLGKKTGVCQGKGGSMHLSDFSMGSLGETSIVGSGGPVVAGAALGAKLQGSDRVALCFFGDGASSEGAIHEGMNLAAVWKLPAIFVCENNRFGMSTPTSDAVAGENVADRAHGYGIPGVIVDGQDVDAVEEAVREAVDRARAGKGPTLIETKTYRYGDHAVNMGRELTPRGPEHEDWLKRDPIVLYRERLVESGIDEATLDAIEKEAGEAVEDALKFARESEYPEFAEAFDHVYSERLPIPEDVQAHA